MYIKYIWFVNELFVGNIILKRAWAHLFAIKWFQVLLSNIKSFNHIQLNCFKYYY